jgi:hypothetical protein
MSYSPVRSFGAAYNISTPWGKTGINVPVEQIAHNTANAVLNAAWPPLESRLRSALPGLIDIAMDEAIPALKAELPYLMTLAIEETRPELRKEMARTTDIVTKRAVGLASAMAIVIFTAAWWTRRAVKKG